MGKSYLAGLIVLSTVLLAFVTPGGAQALSGAGADLSVTATLDNAAPREGDMVTYTIELANLGRQPATNVQVNHLLPDGVNLVSSSVTRGTYVGSTGVWGVTSLSGGATETLSVTARVAFGTEGSRIVDVASIAFADQLDENPANDSARVEFTALQADRTESSFDEDGIVPRGTAADLGVTKSVDVPVPAELSTINYTVVLTNNGPDTATNIQVNDLLPTGVTFVSSSVTQGTYIAGSGIWVLSSLANAASDTLTITATVDSGTAATTIVNTATVAALDQSDGNSSNDSDDAPITVQGADLAIIKTVDDNFPNEGQSITYTVVLDNNGPSTATNVQVTDLLPSGVTFVSRTLTQGTYSSGTGVWVVGSVSSGGSAALTLTATVDAGTGGTSILNTASVTASDQADDIPGNDSDSVSLTVQVLDLAVTKTVDDSFPNEGDTIDYTVILDNNGPDTGTNVEVTDVLPSGLTYVSSSATQGTYSNVTGIWSVASIASGGSDVLTITATVDAGTGASTIVNTATVDADQADSNAANDSDSANLTVQSVDLAVTKTVDDAAPSEGQTINYTVVLDNGGPDAATNVEVTDLLPSGVTFVSSSATQGTYTAGTGVWSLASIAAAASDTLTITATVDVATGGTTIGNTATLTGSEQADSNPANDSDSADISVQEADLAITKTVDDSFPNEGDTINYTVVLTNNGPDGTTNVEVTDVLPAGVTFVSSSATQGTYSDVTSVWSVAGLASAASDTLTITATIDAGTNGSTIDNTASVTASDQPDNNPADDSDGASLLVQSVDLVVTKTVDDAFPNEGATINYTVVLDNNGPDTATNVDVTDVLPAGVTFVSSSATQGTYNDGTGIWGLASLAAAGSDTLTITATVDAGTNGSTIDNTATVTASDQGDSNPADNSDSASFQVQSVDLAVTKTVDDNFPNEGGTINYTVVLDNNGTDTATNVTVTDVLPAAVTFVSSSATQGTYVDGTGIWSVASLAAAASDTLTITATVDAGTNGSTIVNTASYTSSDQADGNPVNDSDSASLLVQSVDLAVTKTVDDNFPNEGGTINYTVVLDNNGPDTATNVTLTDLLPAGVTFVSSSATQGAYVDGTGIWSVASIAAAASDTLTITATIDAGTNGSTIVNTASYTSSDQADSNPANDSDSASLLVQSVDLAVTKTVDDSFPNEGSTINYTVVLDNNGPDTATNVDVTDLLPGGVTFVSSSATQGTYNDGSGIWNLASLANAASDTLTITATIDAGTGGATIVNTANVTDSDQADSNLANDIDTASLVVQTVDLQVVKTVNDPSPNEGDAITYTVVLNNIGTDPATGVELTDLLPAGVTFVSAVATQGSYVDGTGLWTVGTSGPAASDTLTITASVDVGTNGTTIVNTAAVTASDQADGNPANDSDAASVTVQSADLAITKTVDDSFPNEGATIQYTVVLDNNGPDTGTNIQVTDLLPAGVTFVSAGATTGTYVAGTGIWSVGSVPNAGSETLTITATVDAGTNGTTILNTASVTASDQAENNPANDTDSASLTVQSIDLAITKIVDDSTPNEGDSITYTIDVSNSGPDTATNVDVTDLLPAGLTFVSSSATQGAYNDGSGIWSLASLANGAADTLTITATVDAGTGASTIVNTASRTGSDQTDSNPANDSDSASLTVQSVDLAVTKTVDDPTPSEGGTINYSVVLANSGPDAGTNVEVTDILPAGVTFVSSSATQGTYNDVTGVWGVANIASGAADTLTITVTVDIGTGGTSIDNTASLTASDQADSNGANDSDNAGITVQAADLAVTKNVDDAGPPEGGTINYTVVVTNNGPDTTTNVGVTDQLPAGVTFSASAATQGSYNSGTGVWTVGTLANAASATLTITATVDAATGGTTIVNSASVTASDQPDNAPGNNSDSASITVDGADLAITKTVDDPTPPEGGTINYTVVLTNNGPDGATNIQVNDLLPTGVTFAASSVTNGVYISGSGVWILSSVGAATSDTLSITATVDVGTSGSTITNTASVAFLDQSDGNPANDSDSADIDPQGGADLAVTKAVDDPTPSEGNTIVYSVVLTNNGPVGTTNVEVTDLLPTGVTFVSSTETQGTYTSGTGVWSLASIAAAASDTLSITATVDAGTVGNTITNTATITASDEVDGNASNDTDSVDITVTAVDLAVVKTVDDPSPNEGGTITYTVVLTNGGPGIANNVEVTDLLPAGVTFVSSTETQGSYVDGTGVWSLASVAVAASDTLTITATVDAGTAGSTIVNTASVTAVDEVDTNPANDSDTADINVQGADLAVTKTVDDAGPDEGATINYTVVVDNLGPDAATNVEVTDLLPAGVTFVSSTETQGTYTAGTGVWSLASIAAAASDTLTITATVDAGTGGQTIVNTASVTASDQADGDPGNNSDTADITVASGADLAVTKTVDDPAPLEGGTIVYSVVVDNLGPDAATNVEVTDLLPAGVTFVSSTETQGTYTAGTGVWSLASMAAAASDTLTITATVDGGTAGSTIVNTATVTASDQVDDNPANDSDTADVTVQSADLAITKTVDDSTPEEGGTITYTIVLTNNGPDATANVTVTDMLPAGVTFVSSTVTQGTYVDVLGFWSLASVANATSDTLAITATVDAGTGGTNIDNTASVTASDLPDTNPANDSDTAGIFVLTPGGETQVTTNGGDRRPNWSPGGIVIAFDSNRSGNQDIWTVPETGGVATQITTDTDVDQDPDWSPDSTQFVYRHGTGNSDIWLISSAGGTGAALDVDASNSDRFPAWSPDGSQIAYEKSGDIYVIPSTGGVPVQITTDPGIDAHPTWSSDGTQLAFISNRGGNNDVYTIPAAGGSVVQVTTNAANEGAPDWSPDGTQIAFQSNRSGNNDIWVIPATGGVATQITTDSGNDAQPDWSPGGDRLAFARIGVGIFVYAFPSAGADLAVTKSVDTAFPNELNAIVYTIGLMNNSLVVATGVELTDLLPAGVTFVSSTETVGSYNDGTGVWTVGTVGAGLTETLTINATVDAGTGGQTITNTATVTASDQPDSVPGNDSDSADITVQSADLAIVKTVDDPAPSEGATIVYTVELTNNGPFTGIGIQVTDALPVGVTFVSATTTQGAYDDGTGVWTVGNMVASTADTLSITATVDAGTSGLVITNTASVTAVDQADPVPGNDSDSADITVGTATGVVGLGSAPTRYALGLSHPNPFRQATTIPFDIPVPGRARVSIWDVSGRLVRTLVEADMAPGSYHPRWDGRDETGQMVSSGVYFVRFESGSFVDTRKVIRMR